VIHLRKIMLEELQRRNYSDGAIRHHLRAAEEFPRYFGKPPDQLGLASLRTNRTYLLKDRKLAFGSARNSPLSNVLALFECCAERSSNTDRFTFAAFRGSTILQR